jgi:hypothetical protein
MKLFENIKGNTFRLIKESENINYKTFKQIRDELDPDGKKHDLTLHCIKCNTTETCKCSKPKRKFDGICPECSEKL